MKKGSSKTAGSSTRMSAARATSAQSFGPEKAKIGSCMSDLGDLPATHEAGRTDGEDDQDEKERDAFLEVRVDHPEQLLEEPDHQAADETADRILEPPEDRRRERLDARHSPHIGAGKGDRSHEHAAEPGERAGEYERRDHLERQVDPL